MDLHRQKLFPDTERAKHSRRPNLKLNRSGNQKKQVKRQLKVINKNANKQNNFNYTLLNYFLGLAWWIVFN